MGVHYATCSTTCKPLSKPLCSVRILYFTHANRENANAHRQNSESHKYIRYVADPAPSPPGTPCLRLSARLPLRRPHLCAACARQTGARRQSTPLVCGCEGRDPRAASGTKPFIAHSVDIVPPPSRVHLDLAAATRTRRVRQVTERPPTHTHTPPSRMHTNPNISTLACKPEAWPSNPRQLLLSRHTKPPIHQRVFHSSRQRSRVLVSWQTERARARRRLGTHRRSGQTIRNRR